MTATTIDTQAFAYSSPIARWADAESWMAGEPDPGKPVQSFLPAFAAVQKFRDPSSKIQFAELPTAILPTTNDLIVAVFDHLSKYNAPVSMGEMPSWDVQIDLPPWRGPDGIRVQALVKKVSRGTFRPITEDEITQL